MGKMKEKFMTMLTTALTVGSVFPYSVIGTAEATEVNEKATIIEAKISDDEGNALGESNRIEKGSEVTLDLKWETAKGAELAANETQTFQLPKNLSYEAVAADANTLDGEAGTYTIDTEHKTLTMTFNDNASINNETKLEEHQQYSGTVSLKAKTGKVTEATEAVALPDGTTTMIYYLDEDSGDDDGEPAQQTRGHLLRGASETPKTQAERTEHRKINDYYNIFNNAKLYGRRLNEQGQYEEYEITAEDPLLDPSYVSLKIDWSFENDWDIIPGDWYEYTVPSQLDIYGNGIVDEKMWIDPDDHSKGYYGSFKVGTDGKMIVEFADGIDQVDGRSGTISVTSSITIDYTEEQIPIDTGIFDNANKEVTLVVTVPKPSINKQFLSYNASTDRVKWEIIINEEEYDLVDAVIMDYIPAGMSYNTYSATYLSDNLDGNGNRKWEKYTDQITQVADESNRKFTFKDSPMSKTVKLVVETNITDKNLTKFENKAKLTGYNFAETESSATFSRDSVEEYKIFKGFDQNEKRASWEIKVVIDDTNAGFIDTTYDTDPEKATHHFDKASLEWEKDGVSLTGSAVPTGQFTNNKANVPVKMEFQNLAPGTYILNYDTIVTADPLPLSTEIVNKMESKTTIQNTHTVKSDKTAGVEKKDTGTDYNKNEAGWSITSNSKHQELYNLEIEDVFGDLAGKWQTAMKLMPAVYDKTTNPRGFKVTATPPATGTPVPNVALKELERGTDYDLVPRSSSDSDYSTGFIVKLKGSYAKTNHKITLEFYTKFDPMNNLNADGKVSTRFRNSVRITYKDKSGTSFSEETYKDKWLNAAYQKTGFKNGLYLKAGDTLEYVNNPYGETGSAAEDIIHWSAVMNMTKETLPSGTIITEKLAAGQTYIPNSLVLRKVILGSRYPNNVAEMYISKLGEELVINKDYTVNENTDGHLEIKLIGSTNEAIGVFLKAKPNDTQYLFENAISQTVKTVESEDITASVSVATADQWLTKEGNENQVNGSFIDWQLTINKRQVKLSDGVIVDKIDYSKHTYVLDENGNPIVNIYEADATGVANTSKKLPASAYDIDLVTLGKEQVLTITFNQIIDKTYVVQYQTKVDENAGAIVVAINNATLKGKTTNLNTVEVPVEIRQTIGSGTSSGVTKELTVNKTDEFGTPVKAIFNLYKLDKDSKEQLYLPNMPITGKEKITNLRSGIYVLREVSVEGNYIFDKNQAFTIDLTNDVADPEVTNVINYKKTDFSVEKKWNDNENAAKNRPDKITVGLYDSDDMETELKRVDLESANLWKHTWTDLPENKMVNGTPTRINYVTKEITVNDNYTGTSVTTGNTSTITNDYTPAKTSVKIKKVWEDGNDQDAKRPGAITVNLFANGDKVKTETFTPVNNKWEFEFTDLDRDFNQEPILYTVTEEKAENYDQPTINETGKNEFTITNKRDTDVTSIKATKVWEDGFDQDGKRPETITLQLIADGDEANPVREEVVEAAKGWTYTFENLQKNKAGKAIVYTVKEVPVDGYKTAITGDATDGYIVTNSYTPEKTSIKATKVWNDGGNQDGNRPDTIKLQLFADDELLPVREEVVEAAKGWTFTFSGLPKNKAGKAIVYTVKEVPVTGYTTKVTGNAKDGFVVTNSYKPLETKISATKVWKDGNNQDGNRPDTIKLQLIANGDEANPVKEVVVEAAKDWNYTFTGLPMNKNGKAIKYTVKEVAVAGYTTEITGDAAKGFTVTNSYTPKETEIKGQKVWDDNKNQDGIRPESIKVQLFANGQQIKEITVDGKGDTWSYTFGKLPVNENGKAIKYEVKEVAVAGYEAPVIDGFTITNTHKPETIKIQGKKSWDDSNNHFKHREEIKDKNGENKLHFYLVSSLDGKRPGIDAMTDEEEQAAYKAAKVAGSEISINVDLTNPEQKFDWHHLDLPKYQDGKLISYWVVEETVENYGIGYDNGDQDADGNYIVRRYDVVNRHNENEDLLVIEGEKFWEDEGDKFGIRPESITIELMKKGQAEPVAEKTVKADKDGKWSYKWELKVVEVELGTKLDDYYLREKAVNGYTTGYADQGFNITNKLDTVEKEVVKTWDDNENQDGIRPESIQVQLLQNGEAMADYTAELTAENSWAHVFKDLPKTDADGKEYVYTIAEIDVPKGYESVVDGMNVTNTHKPEETEIMITKVWDDQKDADKIRPGEITVQLFANDEATPRKEVKVKGSGDTWTYTFTGLPVYENGKVITYTVKEVAVKDYTTEIKGSAKDGFTITNSHTPKLPDVPSTSRPTLPRTGSELLMWMPGLGLALMLAAILGYGRKRRNMK